ncbi:MAG: J domain-containing protein [Acidimicrobiales bacterium]
MTDVESRTLYQVLGVPADCSLAELRAAYRRQAREHHPDVAGSLAPTAGVTMADINEAWRVLSDGTSRQRYDESVRIAAPTVPVPQPAPRTGRSRRMAWAASVQGQIARLAGLAGRSATQTLLIRHPRGARADYEIVVDQLVHGLCRETESRVRAARAAGAAPLDLAVGATLVGIRTLADGLRRNAPLGITTETLMAAELLDRMWDILAHELPVQLTAALGGNPHIARTLTSSPRSA